MDFAALDRKGADYLNREYSHSDAHAGTARAEQTGSDQIAAEPAVPEWAMPTWSTPNWDAFNVTTPGVISETSTAGTIGEPTDGDLSAILAIHSRRPVNGVADAWARALRRFARVAVWALPGAAICIAVAGVQGWPTAAAPDTGSGGSWLVLTTAGLVLAVVGVVAISALLAATPGSWCAAAAVVAVITGSLLLAPVLGLVGLARPAGSRLGDGVAAVLEAQVFETAVTRWFGLLGLVLLGVAGIALGCAVLAAGTLNRGDGWLVFTAVALAGVSAYTGWQFLLVIAAMSLLAAGLGLAWTASRLTPDGVLTET